MTWFRLGLFQLFLLVSDDVSTGNPQNNVFSNANEFLGALFIVLLVRLIIVISMVFLQVIHSYFSNVYI